MDSGVDSKAITGVDNRTVTGVDNGVDNKTGWTSKKWLKQAVYEIPDFRY